MYMIFLDPPIAIKPAPCVWFLHKNIGTHTVGSLARGWTRLLFMIVSNISFGENVK